MQLRMHRDAGCFRSSAARRFIIGALLLLCVVPAPAELLTFSGSVFASVREFIADDPASLDEVTDSFPLTSDTLPLQEVARLLTEEQAAASVAVQFADPRTLDQANPEEFAINLALLSTSPSIRYEGSASSEEIRSIRFTPAEFPGREAGDLLDLRGILFLDGALAIFSSESGRDLSGAAVTLTVEVFLQPFSGGAPAGAEQPVFSGTLTLLGAVEGTALISSAGAFPVNTLISSNLGPFLPEYPVFRALIIPRLTIGYDYQAVVDQEFTLRAAVAVAAKNVENEVGVLAALGTPVDAIQEVIDAAQGEGLAAKLLAALATERAAPTGDPAFPDTDRAAAVQPALPMQPLLPACGALGCEALLALGLLAGLRFAGR